MAMFAKGIVLAQHKEPAFSRPLVRFVNPQTESLRIDWPHLPDIETAAPDEIVEIAKAAQIVDERDGRMLYRKLLTCRDSCAAVIADAVDDEPYVSSQINPMLKLRDEAVAGLRLCARATGCDRQLIMAYKNLTDVETRIPHTINAVKVTRIRGGYPAESRLKIMRNLGEGKKLIVGAGALIHLYRAVAHGKRQSTAFITVAGNCVANSMNIEASLGMTVLHVLERCGLTEEPGRVVCGGSMTGISILDAEKTLITYTTRAVLAFRDNRADALYNCIGCGQCERVCPAGLNPMYIQRFASNAYYRHLRPFDAHLCTGCGTCSYICPSKLNVAGTVARAKAYALSHFVKPKPQDDEEADLIDA